MAVLVLFSLVIPLGYTDRCILPISDVDVYGPGQKAIVAWNGQIERLTLSTDLYASADAKVLEVLPLPSEPTVDAGTFQSFQAIQQLMTNNLPRVATSGKESLGLEIVFHERIGAHDIDVVRSRSIDELLNFMLNYTGKMGVNRTLSVGEKTRSILEDYLTRGFNYWVFDLVDLHSAARSIEPIVYEFQSSSLYYPLKVSATAKGHTQVILYLITPRPVVEEDIPAKMRFARYEPVGQEIQFQLSLGDLSTIDPRLTELFPVADGPAAWFTAAKYEGELSDLDFDFEISQRPITCRSMEVSTDRPEYKIGGSVRITVQFMHLLPSCAEIAVLHSHQVRLEVLDSTGVRVEFWQWQTDSDLSVTATWKPHETNMYKIIASSWWDGQKLEVEAETTIAVSSVTPPDTIMPGLEIRWLVYGVIIATACIFVGVGITYFLLRSKPSTQKGSNLTADNVQSLVKTECSRSTFDLSVSSIMPF